MLRPRIIPMLLVQDKGLVKTIKFKDPKYVGDPLNAVKIFNEKEVDELIILDIDATVKNKNPDLLTIQHWASECRMPLCYGGGVSSVKQIQEIISLGVEKVAINTSALLNPDIINQAASLVGNQSIVVVIDCKKRKFSKHYDIYFQNGKKKYKIELISWILEVEKRGAGEIIINSIDKDGLMSGYDMELIRLVKKNVSIPVTALGGCGSLNDMKDLINEFGIIGAGAGSMFVFKGRFKAVLINYPSKIEKLSLLNDEKNL
jgi:cyclase